MNFEISFENLKAYLPCWFDVRFISSVVIIAIGASLLRKVNKVLSVFWKKSNIDSSITGLINYIVKFALYVLIILLVLRQFGPLWDVIAPLSASIVAISVLFKENISNFISGIFIVLHQPIHIGDRVTISSNSGTVIQIGYSFTTLRKDDGDCIVVPNTKVMSEIITRNSVWNVSPVVLYLNITPIQENSKLDNKVLQNMGSTLESDILLYSKDALGSPAPKLEYLSTDNFPIKAKFTIWVNKKCDDKIILSMKNLVKNKFPKFAFDVSLQQDVEST